MSQLNGSYVLWASRLRVHYENFLWIEHNCLRKRKSVYYSCFIIIHHSIYHDSVSLSLNRKNICDTVLSIEIFSCQYSSHVMATDPRNDLENYQNFVSHSIIGVVGDVRREMSGHHYAEVTCNTTQIWETIMSTYRDKCGVSRLLQSRQRSRRFVSDKTLLVSIVKYDSAHSTYLETFCVHSDVAQIWVVRLITSQVKRIKSWLSLMSRHSGPHFIHQVSLQKLLSRSLLSWCDLDTAIRNQELTQDSQKPRQYLEQTLSFCFNDNWLFQRCKYSVSIKSFHPLQEKESPAILKGKNHLTIEYDVIKAAIEHSNLWIWRHYLGLSPLKLSVWYIYTDREWSQTEFSW